MSDKDIEEKLPWGLKSIAPGSLTVINSILCIYLFIHLFDNFNLFY